MNFPTIVVYFSMTFSAGGEPIQDAPSVIQSYNLRLSDLNGYQDVTLELYDHSAATARYNLTRLFIARRDIIVSIIALTRPKQLAGTAFRLGESLSSGAREVHLFLPSGTGRVFKVESDRFEESLLGSNFSYEDLSWLLPTNGWKYSFLSEQENKNFRTYRILAISERLVEKFPVRVLYLDRDKHFLWRKEYYRSIEDLVHDSEPVKATWVENAVCVGETMMPQLWLSRSTRGEMATITMQSFHYSVGLLPDTFSSQSELTNALVMLHDARRAVHALKVVSVHEC